MGPKLDPMVIMMPNITSSTPTLLLPMCSNGVTVVETIPNISEKNTCPKRHTTSKLNCDGEMLMRVKENNSTITTTEHMPPHTKHLSTVHPSKCQPTQPNFRSMPYVKYHFAMYLQRAIISNKISYS